MGSRAPLMGLIAAAVVLAFVPPIPQPGRYYEFADRPQFDWVVEALNRLPQNRGDPLVIGL